MFVEAEVMIYARNSYGSEAGAALNFSHMF